MAAVSLQCPVCAGKMTVDSRLCGQQLTCSHCHALIAAPALQAESFPAAPPLPQPPPSSQPPPTPLPSPLPLPPRPASIPGESLLQLACPQCGGVFQAPLSSGGSLLPCPLCRTSIAIPSSGWQSATHAPPSPAPHFANRPVPVSPPNGAPAKAVASGESEEGIRRLTPEERARRRWKRNLFLLLLGGLLLLGSLYVVLRLGPWS